MGWQPGQGGGTGERPDRGPGTGGAPPTARDQRFGEFTGDGSPGAPVPSGRLALLADELSGAERRCPGATDNELIGMLRAWAAIESWASGAKLGVIRELVRRESGPRHGGQSGDRSDEWSQSLRHELAAALACSTQAAETTAWLAWEQQARLPGIGALLDTGTLTFPKARAVTETFKYLTGPDAARAEALILDQLAGKTYTQVLRLAEQAALTVDPGLAERRREQSQHRDARVALFRELSGTAGLAGRDLPPDEALTAMASVNARAEEYKDSDAFGDTRMDVLRAQAYLDLLNGVPAHARIANAEPQDDAADAAEALAWAEERAARAAAERPDGHQPRSRTEDLDGADDSVRADRDEDGPGGGGPGPDDPGPGGLGPDDPGPQPGPRPARVPSRRPADLIVPLVTLLGLAERPGEVQGFGLLDPGLARELAAAAAVGPRTEVCVTVTSPEGYAIGHGCARPEHRSRGGQLATTPGVSPPGLPARLNLTIPAAALSGLTGNNGRAGPWAWAFIPHGRPAPPARAASLGRTGHGPLPDGYGTWTLTLPDGRNFTVRLDLLPTFECDHRYETHGYQPGDMLRHLVQVRDGTCTFPPCSRHARESDFEHALPYDKGGRTCTCNAGARSRACHRVKQSPGWNVTQPRPGWHRWETPSGHVYTQEPKRYPA
jgi:hypothetical protein